MENIKMEEEVSELIIPKKEKSRVIYGKSNYPPIMMIRNDELIRPYFDLNNLEQKFKISPFTKIFEDGTDRIALFHSFLSNISKYTAHLLNFAN